MTPGDNVGMVLTLPRGNGTNATRFLLQNVRVLAVGATALTTRTAQGGGGRVNQGKGAQNLTAITLAIKQQYVEQRRARGRGRRDLPDADATECGAGGDGVATASPTATSSPTSLE